MACVCPRQLCPTKGNASRHSLPFDCWISTEELTFFFFFFLDFRFFRVDLGFLFFVYFWVFGVEVVFFLECKEKEREELSVEMFRCKDWKNIVIFLICGNL